MHHEVSDILNDDYIFMLNPIQYEEVREKFAKGTTKETKSAILEHITTEQVGFMTGAVFGVLSFVIILVLLKESLLSLLDLRKDEQRAG